MRTHGWGGRRGVILPCDSRSASKELLSNVRSGALCWLHGAGDGGGEVGGGCYCGGFDNGTLENRGLDWRPSEPSPSTRTRRSSGLMDHGPDLKDFQIKC